MNSDRDLAFRFGSEQGARLRGALLGQLRGALVTGAASMILVSIIILSSYLKFGNFRIVAHPGPHYGPCRRDQRAIIATANGVDLIGANPQLAQASRWMITQTNAELRLRQRIAALRDRYDVIVIDSCPGLGALLNSTLNAADRLIIPVDPGFYGYMGIQELRNEVEEIRTGTNPSLAILGVVLTLMERTVIARETFDALVAQFGDLVFETQIRRCVALRESPTAGFSVFRYSPKSNGAEDYANLTVEVLKRLHSSSLQVIQGVGHA